MIPLMGYRMAIVMIWQKEALLELWGGIFDDQIRKCRHAEFFGNPVVNVLEGVDPQFFGGLDNGKEGVFCGCSGLGYRVQADILPAFLNSCPQL